MSETIEIECSGYSIIADWYNGSEVNNILLELPGYGSTRSRHRDFVSAIVKRTGISALVIDYSGHGDSPFELKETRPAQHFLEVIYAFDWLRKQYSDAKIAVGGSSYGGFMAAQLTQYREFEKLGLRAPAIYEPADFYDPWAERLLDEEGYRTKIMKFRQNSEAINRHPLLARASKFNGKTLVVVHENDELVPRVVTDAYIKALDADSFIAEGFTHILSQSPINEQQLENYQNQIADWLK